MNSLNTRNLPPIQLPFGKTIGQDKTFIIAEIGSNHNGDLQRALDTIDAAAECGADAAKFQSLNLYEQWHQPTPDVTRLHQQIDLDESWYPILKERCDRNELIFFSAPTYLRAVELLLVVDVCLFKLASAQIGTFPQIVERVAQTEKPVLISTGIVTESELEQNVRILKSNGTQELVILHCNSIYPTPADKVYLPRMIQYRDCHQVHIGFSDHTEGTTIPIAAVAMGAQVIEKHFLLDRNFECPDAVFSLDPNEFQSMTQQIRQVELSIRSQNRTQLEPEETQFKNTILQKLILKHPKNAGDRFRQNDFHFRRNANGIDCRELPSVIDNFVAATQLNSDQLLEWNQIHKVTDAKHEHKSLSGRA